MSEERAPASGTGNADASTARRQQEPFDSAELPFLVTHWLRNFPSSQDSGGTTTSSAEEKHAALARIQRAAGDLASAFSTLGAFGSSTVASLNLSVENQQKPDPPHETRRNVTFDDLSRQWAGVLPGNHLNNLVNAAATTAIATEDVVSHCAPSNLVDAANEAIHQQRRNPTSGRTVQDAIDLEQVTNNNANDEAEVVVPVKPSILQPPAKVDFDFGRDGDQAKSKATDNNTRKMPALESEMKDLQKKSSQAMRTYLELKVTYQSQEEEIRKLSASLELHERNKQSLQHKRLAGGASLDDTEMVPSEEEQNASRVIAQLERKLGDLSPNHAKTKKELAEAKQQAFSNYENAKKALLGHRDPFCDAAHRRPGFGANVAQNNGILRSLETRRLGLQNRQSIASLHHGLQQPSLAETRIRSAVLESRLSHAVTMNSHLHYPVYSIRFDTTGRYFVTGADDTLVRVFCLGAKQRIDETGKGVLPSQDQTIRGAVLVCTLKGHAGVINAIDISADNCFIATASDDWDCRVWGLKDGAPVAILRGHAGGCHMVRWSKLTPYRLVTAGDDGLGRAWDIRLAALKRYGSVVGKRPEYALRLTKEDRVRSSHSVEENAEAEERPSGEPAVAIPPIPDRPNADLPPEGAPANAGQPPALRDQPMPDADQAPALPNLPMPPPLPLPPPADAAVAAPGGNNNDNNNNINNNNGANQDANNAINAAIAQRRFVANGEIDEGVKLLAKFQHGASLEERMAAPGTRSRRAPVRILCLVRSPFGGHFATGASDGICRIWEDEEDQDVETVDKRACKASFDWIHGRGSEKSVRRGSRVSNPSKLILQLKGHLNPITDLQYSHAGDRIMTGSQLDGVVRIWSWDIDPSIPDLRQQSKDRGVRSIVIKLTNPMASTSSEPKKSRRRVAAGSASNKESKIQLDVAVWTHDDSKIITSQSQMIREGKMQPDTNFMFLWDAQTGHCLLGIAGGHSMNCQVILPHPTNSSVFCSGGLDGYMKVWDVETGKCIFSHKNEPKFGQGDAAERGGFLDGACFPDGTGFILTDNSGSICVFDSILTAAKQKPSSDPSSLPTLPPPPSWLKEQYFSNDYYDLYYDTNGYCVEQGSEMPPHLAPRGVRCSHSGAPFPNTAKITEAFKTVVRPLPSSVRDCQWLRESIRSRARVARTKTRVSSKHRRANIMQEFDPLTTILVRSSGEVIETRNENGELVVPTSLSTVVASPPGANRQFPSPSRRTSDNEPRRSSYSGRQLSTNYRWRDYTDMLREERNFDDDSDDEEFQPAAARDRTPSSQRGDSDDESEDLQEASPSPRTTSRQQTSRQQASRQQAAPRRRAAETVESPEVLQPSRSSRRRLVRERGRYLESDSDEEVVEEFLSTNNDPSGPHVEDYNTHFFKLPSSGPKIQKDWLRRVESDSSFLGRKVYAPQVGDTVVYIARAHFETLQSFASMKVPFHDWPQEAEWPVVRCCIRDIRYRFPYINFYGGRNSQRSPQCTSIVAILTLEVTGIPMGQRDFQWQLPQFVEPARSHIFEVGLFQSDHEEYIIPFDRYLWSLQCLEEAIVSKHYCCEGINVSCRFVNEDTDDEDADLILYAGKLEDFGQRDTDNNDANLNNTGYESIRIGWTENGQHSSVSPWDVIVDRPKSKKLRLSRPCLDDDEKKRARDALKNLKRIPQVREQLICAVNQRQYTDYSCRVEVPMHLGFVERRLEANYYSSRMSIVADVKLIRDNCLKYNGEVGLLQDGAREMYDQFERDVLNEEERTLFRDVKVTIANKTRPESTRPRSSLENLPEPPASHEESGTSSRRRSLRIRIDSSQVQASQAAMAPARALRSNSEVSEISNEAPSASFANAMARGRQPRRSSSSNGQAAPNRGGRRDRGRARGSAEPETAQPPIAPPPQGTRRSARMRGMQANPESENLSVARSHGHDNGETVSRSRRERARSTAARPPPAEENPSESEESDAKPPARQTRNSRRASFGRDAESESEQPPSPQATRTSSRSRSMAGLKRDVESEPEHPPSPQATRRSSRSRSMVGLGRDVESEPEHPPSPQGTRRSRSRSMTSMGRAIKSESEHPTSPEAARRSSRTRSGTRRSDAQSESDEEEPNHSTPMNNRKRRARPSLQESDNDEVEDSSDQESVEDKVEEMEEEEEEASNSESEAPSPEEPSARRSSRSSQRRSSVSSMNNRTSRRGSQPSVASSRRSSRGGQVASYAEHSGSEFSEIEPSESEEEVEKPQRRSPPKKRARGKAKGKAKAKQSPKKRKSPAKTQRKRKRADEFSDESEEDDYDYVVQRDEQPARRKRTKIWHEIDSKHITSVTRSILEFYRCLDEQEVFAVPVAEKHPDVKQAYNQKISTPMDFQTIEEDRIQYYSSITELQKDLILTFQNCIDFNGTLSDYGQFAQQLLDMLDDAFEKAVADLPGR
ncbi:bromodomain and WD repeat domain containing [Seminavis robusta]|uniref:Bromodomain and WD repeat domain containing n=1 Tax=Seminavis robusta TaxID=568900 RepID=A0A9N8EJN0_9STRA|nr:bromodomain and WD repeat domain containing [Seminavis robusta]|eukprot:Sro1039_g234360.1 bromodomain and WD repeat domain containing (2418) ;mRNA; f:6920-14975